MFEEMDEQITSKENNIQKILNASEKKDMR